MKLRKLAENRHKNKGERTVRKRDLWTNQMIAVHRRRKKMVDFVAKLVKASDKKKPLLESENTLQFLSNALRINVLEFDMVEEPLNF